MGFSTNTSSLALKISTFFQPNFSRSCGCVQRRMYAEFFVLFYKIEWRELGNPAVVRVTEPLQRERN